VPSVLRSARAFVTHAAVEGLPDPRIAAAVGAYFDLLNAGQEAAWLALFADDAVVHDPVGSLPAEGRAAMPEVWRMLHVAFERVTLEAVHTFYGGNGAAVKWSGRGRSPQGREVEFEGISVFEISEGGKVQTLMTYWDPARMMIELADGS